MKKIFIVAGELSGDKLGGWYAQRLLKAGDVELHAVGGDFLKQAGATIYERFEKLNIVGLVEIIKHLRSILSFMTKLADHIVTNNFDEVVVIDFPGFNLRLIKKLKKLNPNIKITYFSPPQLWAWGEGRIKTIKKYVDRVIVLYPFEVEWYKERGVTAEWHGYPFYKKLAPHRSSLESQGDLIHKKEASIAILPGTRMIEITRLLPLFLKVIHRLKLLHPSIKIILPLGESIDKALVEKIIRQSSSARWGKDIEIVQGEKEKYEALSKCCVALTKPGTITLELGLLGVPAVVAYRASYVTYFLAKLLVKIEYMSLPSLLLGEQVYPECLQFDCKEKNILHELKRFYIGFVNKTDEYKKTLATLDRLHDILKS